MAVQGTTLPQFTYVGIAFCTPAMNLIGLAIVMLAITPGSRVEYACSRKWVCQFGKLTYGLYLFHQVYSPIFFYKVTPMLARHMPQVAAQWCAGLIALGLTTGLAWLTNRFVEKPMATLKEKYKYGPTVERVEPKQTMPVLQASEVQMSA
jgi:peptidoglycan/LPS O-acetylase OafA/YrhL